MSRPRAARRRSHGARTMTRETRRGRGAVHRQSEREEGDMRRQGQRVIAVVTTLSFLILMVRPALAADPEMDRLVRGPVGKDWDTNGGNLTNQRYSTLKQIDTTNVTQLKGAWMTRLKGSGFSAKYSLEASPLVKNGVMYVITGNNDVFASMPRPGKFSGSTGPISTRRSRPSAAAGSIAVWP